MNSESETWADAIDRLVAEVENGLVLLSASGPDILDGATLEIRRQKARVAELEAIRDAAVEGLMRADGLPASRKSVEDVWRMAFSDFDQREKGESRG